MKDRDTAFRLRDPDAVHASGSSRDTTERGRLEPLLRASRMLRRRVESALERWVSRRQQW